MFSYSREIQKVIGDAKQGVKSSPRQRTQILLRKTRSKILSSSKDSDFASQNKEDSHERTGNRKQQIR